VLFLSELTATLLARGFSALFFEPVAADSRQMNAADGE
jgi:hypothetical protein